VWNTHGYSGPDSTRGLIDSLVGQTVAIAGNAEGVFEEIEQVSSACEDWPVWFAVNDVGARMQWLDHWVSLHGEKFPDWTGRRLKLGLPPEFKTHSMFPTDPKLIDYDWTGWNPINFGLSGMWAVQLAHVMGAERIILCGCPGDDRPRWDGTRNEKANFAYGSGTTHSEQILNNELAREFKRVPGFKEKIRAMSGRNREIFGSI